MDRYLELMSFGPGGWGSAFAAATSMTVAVSVAAMLVGAMIGALGAWAKTAGPLPVRWAAETYTTILRGIPDLLVIYLFYFGSSAMVGQILAALGGGNGFVGVNGFAAGVLAIGLISGAYQTEVFRGALRAIPRGEIEAAMVFGMPYVQRLRRVILPQLLRHALPGLGNVWQIALKESALVSVTGLTEILRQAQVAAGSVRAPFTFYATAAILYLLLTALSGHAFRMAETAMGKGVRRAAA